MRTAVLKNRLLDITDRRFNENQYGAERVSDLIPMLSEVVSVDTTATPQVLELRPETRALLSQDEELEARAPSRTRVRSDLWNAVLDYSAGATWRWDPDTSRAELAGGRDVPESERLPTIEPAQLAEWRRTFIEAHRGDLSPDMWEPAREWAEYARRSEMLPPKLRGQWFEHLKARVSGILEAWFSERGLPLPTDLQEVRRAPTQRSTDESEALRELVIRCVRSMSLSELASLQLPASGVLRAQRE